MSRLTRLSNSDIRANFSMIEARLRSEPETAEEWIAIRDSLRACTREAERRVAEAKALDFSKEQAKRTPS